MTDETVILPVKIAVSPYLQDHRFEGKAVLPAVEAMQFLAQAVKKIAPRTEITACTGARFDKFLVIDPDTISIDTLCHISPLENGDIAAVLQTKTRSKTAAFTRIKEHVIVHFPRVKPEIETPNCGASGRAESDCLEISPDQIYSELVPFGPAYQNISQNLVIRKDGALGTIQAPDFSMPVAKGLRLGSPFVLDAAFHAACVWGQRYGGMVAFPVAVDRRIIARPTQPGDVYRCKIFPTKTETDRLLFDIFICDEDNALYESAIGVSMRDVSAGRMKPPAWIMEPEGA